MSDPVMTYWLPGELEVWQMLPEISTSQFAEQHRQVTIGAHQGKWSNEITPYLVDIMNTADLPHVHKLVICGPEQSGKTNACINIHLKDIVYNGGNAKFIMFPTENLAKTVATSRLLRIYERCKPIADKFTTNPDDRAAGKIALRDGTIVFPAWATSAAKLSSFPSDFTWGDEVDKNSDLTGDEADALKLLEKRARTFRRFLNLVCSTPTLETGHVWRELNACSDIKDYYVECPHCGQLQLMTEERLTWPGQLQIPLSNPPQSPLSNRGEAEVRGVIQPDADSKVIKEKRLARYRCENDECGKLWDDIDRNRAVRDGAWVSRTLIERPESVGFHITGFICPDISLSEIAEKILQARSGDISAEKERDNSYIGVPHRPKVAGERKTTAILRLCDTRLVGQVPSIPISAITCVADMQKRGFWYTVRAWGFGLEQESWLLQHGYLDSWAALENIFFRSVWHDASGNQFMPTLWAMDSGGGESDFDQDISRTAESYIFACQHPEILLFKGNSRMTQVVSKTTLDRIPGTNKPLPGAPTLYNINTRLFKNRLAAKLLVDPADPGAWHLHSGLTAEDAKLGISGQMGKELLEQFARQMCAEVLIGNNWENPTKKANHLWDCSYMEMALVEIAQVKFWQQQEELVQQTNNRNVPAADNRPGWFNNR